MVWVSFEELLFKLVDIVKRRKSLHMKCGPIKVTSQICSESSF